jgi:hypothetical protein
MTHNPAGTSVAMLANMTADIWTALHVIYMSNGDRQPLYDADTEAIARE